MPKRILIAEDEASVRNAVRTFIESRTQFEVSEAVDGNEAIHKAQVDRGQTGRFPFLWVPDPLIWKDPGLELASSTSVPEQARSCQPEQTRLPPPSGPRQNTDSIRPTDFT
jgi:CheY-like chemotaxis protein